MSDRGRGYALVALLCAVTVMSVAMAAAVPAWKWVVKNDKEEELIFRGRQIQEGIRRFQAKNGNALPVSMEVLVKGKFLRKAYKDPMTKDGAWRLIRQGEAMPGVTRPTLPGAPSPSPSASPSPGLPGTGGGLGGPGRTTVGAFVGVASFNKEKSLRLVNNRDHYNEWFFVAGQPIVVGRTLISGQLAQPGRPGAPGQPPGQPRPPGAVRP